MKENELEFMSKIQLPIVFIVDTSESMAGQRILHLNSVLLELSNLVENITAECEIQLQMRLIEYNTEARWMVGDVEYGVENLALTPFCEALGGTNTVGALKLVRKVMSRRFLPPHSLWPIIFLIIAGSKHCPTGNN